MSRVDSALSLTASSVPTTGAPNSVFSMTSDPIISSQTHQGMLRMERNMDDMSPGDYGMQNFMRMFRACQNGQMPHMNIIGIHVENTGIPILRQEASIHQNFAGPFAENTMLVHPQIADTPKEYQFSTKGKINLPPLNVNKLPDETLLYMYYNFPKEAYQSLAVHMLQKRGWLYHKRAQGWVRRIITKPPAQITPELGADEGIFAFFNPMTWRSENKRLKIANEEFERFGPISENLLHFYRWKQYETLIPVETRGDTLPQPQQVVAVTPTSEI
uniref:NOT2_3_5 domain-containing protein n=1 Tax=Rhabditophanes sp. KR3021 TaxID=114890 RepID=A0AC35TQY0_9BILA